MTNRASVGYAWLVLVIGAALALDIDLVIRASNQGLIPQNADVTPYHLPGYAALFVALGLVILSLDRAVRRRGDWRTAFPPGYLGVGLGVAALVTFIVSDLIWRQTAGVNGGIEGGLAPTRLLVPIGLILFSSGPFVDLLGRGAHGTSTAARLRTVAGVGSLALAAAVGAASIGAHPLTSLWSERPANPATDNSELFVMAADGSHQTRLNVAAAGIDFSLPVWSPDGGRIAYTRWQNTSPTSQIASVWTSAGDGSDAKQLVDDKDWNWIPDWSPDGQWILFTRSPTSSTTAAAPAAAAPVPVPNQPPGPIGPPPGRAKPGLWRVPVAGGDATRLTAEAESAQAGMWSPDGTRIAFTSDRDGDFDVWVMNADGSAATKLTTDPATDGDPSWSPDGTKIAFGSDRTGDSEIWAMNADGSVQTQLTHDPAGDWVPAWSPDGTHIAFTSDRTHDAEVWSMAADGSDLRNLTNNPARIDGQWSVRWSPDGRRLVYASAGFPPADASPLVREDLAVAGMLLHALVLAAAALLLFRAGAPFGSFTALLVIDVVFAAIVSDQWRFLPATVLGGLLVDVGVRWLPGGRGRRVAAGGLPAVSVLGIGMTLALAGTLGWTPTLFLGVAAAAALIGLTLDAITRGVGAAEPPEWPPLESR